MNAEQLHTALQSLPFRPLVVTLLDGRTIKIPHPEFVEFVPLAGPWEAKQVVVWDPQGGKTTFAPDQVAAVRPFGETV